MRRRLFLWRWCSFGARYGLLLLLAAALGGCGGPAKGTVSGQVLFNGKPLPGGVITFAPVDTRYNPEVAIIDENGHYQVTIAVGEALVTVDNRSLQGGSAPIGDEGAQGATGKDDPYRKTKGPPPGARIGPPPGAIDRAAADKNRPEVKSQKQPGTYVPIPRKYYSSETSELTYTVEKGSQTKNIELTGVAR